VERPLRVLKKLAALLSAHELSGSALMRLSAARIAQLAIDPEIQSALTPPTPTRWQWFIVHQHTFRRAWSDAERETAALTRHQDARWEMWMTRGHVLAELARWNDASEAFATALRRRPDWTQLRFYRALARRAGGDLDALRRECAAGLAEHGTTRNPDRAHWLARLCVLDDRLDAQAATRIADLARLASDLEAGTDAFGMVHAQALLRAGQREAAIASMNTVLSRTTLPAGWAEAPALVALARGRAVTPADRVAVDRAAAAPAVAELPWYRRLEASLWREEFSRRR
jgi:predicted Zn-dependent protease